MRRPDSLDPLEIRTLRRMSPEEKLEMAFSLTDMTDALAEAGRRHRAEAPDED